MSTITLPDPPPAAPPSAATPAPSAPPLKAHGTVLNLQIPNGKIATWLFLGSEVMFFTGLIGAYIVLRFGQDWWPDPAQRLNVPLTAANTFLLICSSVTLVWGLQGLQDGNQRQGRMGLWLTTLFGATFVGVQAYEYFELFAHGVRPDSDLFGSCFYAMTSFHGLHVLLGVVVLLVLSIRTQFGAYGPKHYAPVEYAGLYWHFVDLVWIILFAIVYLM
jgi:heme/copper-type cytochrome/quinol oxidase subunit 3